MKPLCHYLTTLLLLCTIQHACSAQESSNTSLIALPAKYFDKVSKKASAIDEKLDAKTETVLRQFQKRQEKIKRKLYKIDSLAAKNIFTETEQRYKKLEQKLSSPQQLSQYIPFLDTLKTSLKFLDKNKELLSKTGDLQSKMDGAMSKVNGLENQLQKAEEVKQFLKQQKQFLKEQLGKFGFARQLKKLNKDVYYYGKQINEYKETIKDPKKIERKAIDIISKTKLFQDFMRKNSMLASLFRMPVDDPNDPAYLQSLAGLQTRAQVNRLVQNQLGTAGSNGMAQLQANAQQAQGELQKLRDKITQYGSNGSDDIMPEGFRPNQQKVKTFWKRWETGTDFKSQRSNGLLPASSDIGLYAGFKLNDRSVIGIGLNYRIGWGQNIRHLKITNEAFGIRSYIDWKITSPFGLTRKLAGALWISGGFEMNHRIAFKKIEQLKQFNAWEQIGLIGISKKFSINTKFFKNTKVSLLWNFLSYSQIPRGQPLEFRVGYNIK